MFFNNNGIKKASPRHWESNKLNGIAIRHDLLGCDLGPPLDCPAACTAPLWL